MTKLRPRGLGAVLLLAVGILVGTWWGSVTESPSSFVAEVVPAAAVEPATAQLVQATEDIYTQDSPIIRVVERVKDAVVNIEAEAEPDRDGRGRDNFWLPFFHPPTGRTQSFGSGFFIRADGTVLTNAHVVSDADKVMVRLSDEHEYEAEILGIDRETDLAVLKIAAEKPVPFIELGESDNLRIGQWVVAIGNPFPRQKLDRTVTVGVISGVGRSALNFGQETPVYQNYIQTDAAINPGNSGGPLVDLNGRAVGVNAAIASPSGGNVGIGFAIPVNYVKAIIDDLVTEGEVSRGFLGIQPGEITPDLAEALELQVTRGVVVQQVVDGEPAALSGIKQGDVIVRFNGESVTDVPQFMFLVAQTKPLTEVAVEVIRDGRSRSVSVVLGDRRQMRPVRASGPSSNGDPDTWFGMRLNTATRELADRYSVSFEPGLIVTEIEPGSEADAKGIARGNIITSVERQEVSSLRDLRGIRADLDNRSKPVLFLVTANNGQPRFVALKNR